MFDKKLERTILKRGCRTVYAHITSKLIAIAQVQIKLQILEELTDFLPERSDRKQQQQSTFYTFITQFHSLSPTHPYCTLFTSSTSIFDAPVPVSPRNKSGRSSQLARPTVPATVSKSAETPYIHIIERETFLVGAFQGTHTFVHFYTVHERVGDLQGNGSSPCPRPISVEYPRKQTPFSPEGNLVSGFLRLGPGA